MDTCNKYSGVRHLHVRRMLKKIVRKAVRCLTGKLRKLERCSQCTLIGEHDVTSQRLTNNSRPKVYLMGVYLQL